jgi:hypothetical protein
MDKPKTTKSAGTAKGQASKRTPAKEAGKSVVVTHGAVLITMSPAMQKQAQKCIKKSGKLLITMNEISVTRLPAVLDNGTKID